MKRRKFLATTGLTAAVLTAGCSETGTDETGQDTSPEDMEFPEGVTEEGITDIDSLHQQSQEAYKETSHELQQRESMELDLDRDRELDFWLDSEENEYLLNQFLTEPDRVNDQETYMSVPRDEAFTYNREEDFFQDHRDQLSEFTQAKEEFQEGYLDSIFTVVGGFEYNLDQELSTEEVVVLKATDLDQLDIFGDSVETDFDLEYGKVSLDSEGIIREMEYDLDDETNGYSYSVEVETSEIDSAEVPRPDWIDQAVEEV